MDDPILKKLVFCRLKKWVCVNLLFYFFYLLQLKYQIEANMQYTMTDEKQIQCLFEAQLVKKPNASMRETGRAE